MRSGQKAGLMRWLRGAGPGLSLMFTAPSDFPLGIPTRRAGSGTSSRRVLTRFTAVSASEASSLIGRRLGRFRILSRIGQGGLATVWRAHDELLGRDVALKVLNDSIAQSPKVRKRFVHEAQAASSLEHPGIVTVFDAGESDGLAFMALTLIDGETVSDLAARRPISIDASVRVS